MGWLAVPEPSTTVCINIHVHAYLDICSRGGNPAFASIAAECLFQQGEKLGGDHITQHTIVQGARLGHAHIAREVAAVPTGSYSVLLPFPQLI